jgi:hypothetical protein
LEIKLDLTVFVKFHSRVSLSSYRMKFVWPESIVIVIVIVSKSYISKKFSPM